MAVRPNDNKLLPMTATSASSIGSIISVKTGSATLRAIIQQDDGNNVMVNQQLHDNSCVSLLNRQHGFNIDR